MTVASRAAESMTDLLCLRENKFYDIIENNLSAIRAENFDDSTWNVSTCGSGGGARKVSVVVSVHDYEA
jgi:hypothetical protein